MRYRMQFEVTLLLLSVFGATTTKQRYWARVTAIDMCLLPVTGGNQTKSVSLSACLAYGLSRQKETVSYDEVSGTCTLHDQSTILNSSGNLYTLKIDLGDCADVDPRCSSKVYRISPIQGNSFDIFCYSDTEQRHWNLIHNRESSAVDFFRNWTEYKTGFGDLSGNFWLGNDNIYSLVRFSPYRLRIELEAWDGTVGIAEYSDFQIGDEADNYQLNVTGFSGNISDSMHKQNGEMFTTKDRDHDHDNNNCAVRRHGAWWYGSCSAANLNGRYLIDTGDSNESMAWKFFFEQRQHVPMKKARMMILRK